MGRKTFIREREVLPDARYANKTITKFITRMMYDGKKATSTRIMYEALEKLGQKTDKDPIEVFQKAMLRAQGDSSLVEPPTEQHSDDS